MKQTAEVTGDVHREKSLRLKLLRDVYLYAGASYAAGVIVFASHVILRNLLGPKDYGTWSLLLLILGYATSGHLGLLNGLQRQLPLYYGKKDFEKAGISQNSACTVIFLTSILMGVLLVLFSVVFQHKYSSEFIWGLRILSGIVVLTQIHAIYITLLQTRQDFVLLSKIKVLFPSLTAALSVLMVVKFGLYGMYAGNLLAIACLIGYVYTATNFNYKVMLNTQEVLYVLRVGVSLFILATMASIFFTLDSIVIANFMGTTELGYYSIALLAQNMFLYIPKAVSYNMYPRTLERYGQRGDVNDVTDYVIKPSLAMAYLSPCILGVFYLSTEPGIRFFMPKYTDGIMATKILLLGAFFKALYPTFQHLLIAHGRIIQLTLLHIIPTLLTGILCLLSVKLRFGIEGIALAMSVGLFVSCTLVVLYAHSYLSTGVINHLKMLGSLYAPFFLTLLALLSIDKMVGPHSALVVQGDVSLVLVKLLLLALFSIPLLFYIDKQTGTISKILALTKELIATR